MAAKTVSEVGVTVEGRSTRRLIVSGVVVLLAFGGFLGGRVMARNVDAGQWAWPGSQDTAPSPEPPVDADSDQQPPAAGPGEELRVQLTEDGSAAPGKALAISSEPNQVETLRFLPFSEPTTLVDAETTTELNNSVGVDTTTLGGQQPVAVVADLVVLGPAGSTVLVHPGDRPVDALQFTIPGNGRLLVPHLVASTDEAGRIVISADEQVRVEMDGIGTYVRAVSSRAGRFVSTGSRRVGSLVTATDGRRLVVALPDVLGADASFVGRAVVRLNANIGQAGGSVAVGSGDPIPWPMPPGRDLGLAATELMTVEPDDQGQIVMDYLGGSVLTVDLVGYYTNDSAPESSSGLLVLSPTPELRRFEAVTGDVPVEIPSTSGLLGDEGVAGQALVTIEVSNGETGGSVTFWNDQEPIPTSAAFALAPNQQRSTTEWFDPTEGTKTLAKVPEGAALLVWMLGEYT